MNVRDNEKLDEVFESMNQVYEMAQNDILIHTNLAMFNGLQKNNWKKYQLSLQQQQALERMLKARGKKILKDLNASTVEALKIAGIPNASFVKDNEEAVGLLMKTARTYHADSVSKVWRLDRTDGLYETILQQVNAGLDGGLRVKHKNGRSYEFKSYMEMNVRTAINQQIVEQQLELNKVSHNVFVVCDEYQDCAKDHAPVQGKIFYDERFTSFNLPKEIEDKIKAFIKEKRLMSIQYVTGPPYYLTTRPNCRHRLVPITIEQAMGNIKEFKEDNHLSTGTYQNKKYVQSQQLRLCERNIRKYKAKIEQFKMINDKSPSPATQQLMQRYQQLVDKWQANARYVVKTANKNGKWLKRDYERETRLAIVQDLGVKYGARQVEPVVSTIDTPTPPKASVEPINKPVEPINKPVEPIIKITMEDLPDNIFTGIKPKEAKALQELFEGVNAPAREQKIIKHLKQINPRLTFAIDEFAEGERDGCFYKPSKNLLSISKKGIKNKEFLQQVVFHELGHSIDYMPQNGTTSQLSLGANTNAEFVELANELDIAIGEARNNGTMKKNAVARIKTYNKEKRTKEHEILEQNEEYQHFAILRENNNQELAEFRKHRDELSSEEQSNTFERIRTEGKAIDKEIARIRKEMSKELKEGQETFKEETIGSEQYQDIVDGIYEGEMYENYKTLGHGVEYYTNPTKGDGRVKTEMFANFFEMNVNRRTRSLEKLKTDYPQIYDVLDRMLTTLSKSIKE